MTKKYINCMNIRNQIANANICDKRREIQGKINDTIQSKLTCIFKPEPDISSNNNNNRLSFINEEEEEEVPVITPSTPVKRARTPLHRPSTPPFPSIKIPEDINKNIEEDIVNEDNDTYVIV